MAAGPNKPRRTPKVAGRSTSRVELSANATAKLAQQAKDEYETPTAVASGVERKRQRADAEKAAVERKRAVTDVEPGVNNTSGTYRLAAILAAAAVVVGVIATILAFHPGAEVSDNRAFVDQGETDRVLSAARDGACSPFTFDYRKLDAWTSNFESKLTGEALDVIRKYAKTSKELAVQTQSASDCRVDVVGLSDLTATRAVVLTDMIVSTTKAGAIDQSAMPHVRLTLVRDPANGDDNWLISNIEAL
ncbi:hypothetical protein nbrc107696_01960 [Gordonia spumicola]|uniref:Mce-associated membrane protein n=1 Tax=Gordonia spumicola TaxID=589161 RepID=A0A7I9V408_9ACTN|nr:hypothetical protein [Gordonia spumicola]GED99749.1 hypothetical protein nbrc107696_01960 [Gordonia spumicola]